MHIVNHYPTPEKDKAKAEPDVDLNIKLCMTYLKEIIESWAVHRNMVPKHMQNEFKSYFSK